MPAIPSPLCRSQGCTLGQLLLLSQAPPTCPSFPSTLFRCGGLVSGDKLQPSTTALLSAGHFGKGEAWPCSSQGCWGVSGGKVQRHTPRWGGRGDPEDRHLPETLCRAWAGRLRESCVPSGLTAELAVAPGPDSRTPDLSLPA